MAHEPFQTKPYLIRINSFFSVAIYHGSGSIWIHKKQIQIKLNQVEAAFEIKPTWLKSRPTTHALWNQIKVRVIWYLPRYAIHMVGVFGPFSNYVGVVWCLTNVWYAKWRFLVIFQYTECFLFSSYRSCVVGIFWYFLICVLFGIYDSQNRFFYIYQFKGVTIIFHFGG